jgi:hypothetical protein
MNIKYRGFPASTTGNKPALVVISQGANLEERKAMIQEDGERD